MYVVMCHNSTSASDGYPQQVIHSAVSGMETGGKAKVRKSGLRQRQSN